MGEGEFADLLRGPAKFLREHESGFGQRSVGGLGTAILIAVFGILAILVLEFRTFRSTLIVASVIPLGIAGGILALFLTGFTLSFTATLRQNDELMEYICQENERDSKHLDNQIEMHKSK